MDTSNQRYKELGNFLKTRREKILPSQVGLSDKSRRRTSGLRREEVAMLAGIGVTWYTWLEQGRSIQVSASVLSSVARVLMLNDYETSYVFELAQVTPIKASQPIKTIQPMFQNVVDSLVYSPSTILDKYWNVIAWNSATSVVFIDFSEIDITNRNIIEIMFTNVEYQKLFENWEMKAKEMISRFRVSCSEFINDPWLKQFIDSLQCKSKEFNQWWSLHDVAPEREIKKIIKHPIVGDLFFEHTVFLTPENELKLYINTPISGTGTEKKVKQLLDDRIS